MIYTKETLIDMLEIICLFGLLSGWLYHTVEQLGEKNSREGLAIHYLKESLEADTTNGQTWYLLGR